MTKPNLDTKERQKLVEENQVFISFIVPAYNEGKSLEAFIPALHDYLKTLTQHFEIIVVDDGSKDNSAFVVRQLSETHQAKLLRFSRNFGKEIAIAAGLQYASGDVAVIIDADFQHPFKYIKEFLSRWVNGYDMVYGVRDNREDESFLKRFFTQTFYKILGWMTDVKIPSNAGDFRLLDRSVVNALNTCEERTRFMKGLYAWIGFKSIGIPYQPEKRRQGKSHWRFKKLTNLAVTGFISFSDTPLRLLSIFGCIISVVSFIYAACIIFSTLFFGGDVPGYATIVVAIMFFGGIQLLAIGVVGEYVGRIFHEVKKRPPYIIEEKIGFGG